MADFVYRGTPNKDGLGLVVSVTPFRGVSADNGLSYRGVLSEDSSGNLFVYRGYPDTIEPRPQSADLFFILALRSRIMVAGGSSGSSYGGSGAYGGGLQGEAKGGAAGT